MKDCSVIWINNADNRRISALKKTQLSKYSHLQLGNQQETPWCAHQKKVKVGSLKLNVTFRSTILGCKVSWQQHIGFFDNEMFSPKLFFMRICLFWEWPWTLSQSWYLSHCEQILALGTSCSEVFVIQSVSLCSWKSTTKLRSTYVAILCSFKLNTVNNSLGTNACHDMEEQFQHQEKQEHKVETCRSWFKWGCSQLHLSLRTPDFQKCCKQTRNSIGKQQKLQLASGNSSTCGSSIGMQEFHIECLWLKIRG